MKTSFVREQKKVSAFLVTLIALSFVLLASGFFGPYADAMSPQGISAQQGSPAVLDKTDPQIQAVIAIQNRNTARLMKIPDVVGTATGLTEDNRPAVIVFARKAVGAGRIPEKIDNVPVIVKITGEFHALRPGKGGGGQTSFSTTAILPLPVPIGVSVGNQNECSSGTVGARVKDGEGNLYALSNNHVFALENAASGYSSNVILQPGLYDTGCANKGNNNIGSLSGSVPIVFSGTNKVDAAIAGTDATLLGKSTPSNGYGTPKSASVNPVLNQPVQKYGRTTSLTKGKITGINATVNVRYTAGTATFVEQIIVESKKAFIKGGDSGSLLVTDPGLNPVGLLFAGNTSGSLAVANRISEVLHSFGVTIDGD